ncbi:co-chaperone GroES [Patescibacteria group bacterium]|nr:co-chaperone GroES [Patescibacteria group bacterium]
MSLKPVSDHIIVKPIGAEKVTSSGIIIPDTIEKERSERGEVIAVGPGKYLENGQRQNIDIVVGQKIIFKKYSADEIEIDGETLLIISADDVIAIIE